MAFLFYHVAGRTLVETAYDEFGRESQLTYGNGNTTTYSYDERHQISSVTSTGDKTQSVTYKYDAKGNIIEKSGEHNNYKYLYDILGRLTSAYGREGHELSVEYDSFNRVISFKNYIGGEGYETRYTYNDVKGIIEKTNSKNTAGESVFEKTYTYDELGRMAEYVYNTANGYTVKYEFLEGLKVDGETTTTTLVKKLNLNGVIYEYSYDSFGNITKVTKTVGETTTVIQSYVYDDLNQLVRENNAETNQTVVYTYDNHGNILSKKIYEKTDETDLTGKTCKTIVYRYEDAWKDLLTEYNGQAITYDTIGNPLTYRDGMSFKWSAGRKLTSFTLNNGASYVNGSYVYDDNGIRVYKNINGNETKYYLDGSLIQTEITNYGGITRRIDYIYDENGSVYGFSVDNKDYYYVKNLQGDIIGILDKTGNLLVEYVYDAYGVPTVSFLGITEDMTDAEKSAIYLLGNNNPFRYRGYYFDVESGLYYLNSRYYDPVTGRFINADNDYSDNNFDYCDNNSINLISSSGKGPSYIHEFVVPELKIMIAVVGMVVEKNTTSSNYPINTIDNIRDVTREINIKLYSYSYCAYQLRKKVNGLKGIDKLKGEASIYLTFYYLVNHKEEWDIKVPKSWEDTIKTPYPGFGTNVLYNGELMTPESLGNYTYGYLGAAFGIPLEILIAGSYYAADFPINSADLRNEFNDWYNIKRGYYAWDIMD